MKLDTEPFIVKPVAGKIGAEITSVRLQGGMEPAIVEALQQLLAKYKVLFFRDQHHIDDAEQEAIAKEFGEPVLLPTVQKKEGTHYLLELDSDHGGRVDSWHTDMTFFAAYPKMSMLRAVVIPESGGDTIWANTAAAYEALPKPLQALADQLWAIHSNTFDYAAAKNISSVAFRKQYFASFASTVYEAEHPLVRVHPVTGERNLVLGHFVKKIVGLSTVDSARVFEMLQDHVIRMENTVRWRWSAGDIVMWDNQATQHYAVNDYGRQHRIVRRVTVAGDIPCSIDGRHSITRK